jgi:hypothetical protein
MVATVGACVPLLVADRAGQPNQESFQAHETSTLDFLRCYRGASSLDSLRAAVSWKLDPANGNSRSVGRCFLICSRAINVLGACFVIGYFDRPEAMITKLPQMIGIGLLSIALVGCGTTKSQRATEQLLMSDAVDRDSACTWIPRT